MIFKGQEEDSGPSFRKGFGTKLNPPFESFIQGSGGFREKE